MSKLWNILTHLPPIIVQLPWKVANWLLGIHYYIYLAHTTFVSYFGLLTLKISWYLTPDCCKKTIQETLQNVRVAVEKEDG